MKKIVFPIVGILLVGTFLRLFQLGKIPVSLSDDEVRLVETSYSLAKTGKDLNGQSLPFVFAIDGYTFNPFPIYLVSPMLGLFGLSIFTARFIFALAGILTILLTFLIATRLFNRKIGLLSALTLTFSAWHIQTSRFASEGGLALFLYTLGVLLFLYIKKGRLLLISLSMLVFFLAFYANGGTKLIYLPIIVVLIWYKFKNLTKRQFLVIISFVLLTIATFAYLAKTQNALSYGQRALFFQNDTKVAEAVELERRASTAPEFLRRLYHNKLTYWSKIFIDHYSYAFSPQYLFTSQEGNGIFAIYFRGQMYYIEVFLLILGLLCLWQKQKREAVLLLLFLAVAPLPSGLGAEPFSYTLRSVFMLPWLFILVGAGIYSVGIFIKERRLRIALYTLLALSYLYLIGGYLNQYYYEWMLYGAKSYSKKDQDLAFLIKEKKETKARVVVARANSITLLHYAFYHKLSPLLVQKLYGNDPIEFDNVLLERSCPDPNKPNPIRTMPKNSTYVLFAQCKIPETGLLLPLKPNLILKYPDGEEEWFVFEN